MEYQEQVRSRMLLTLEIIRCQEEILRIPFFTPSGFLLILYHLVGEGKNEW